MTQHWAARLQDGTFLDHAIGAINGTMPQRDRRPRRTIKGRKGQRTELIGLPIGREDHRTKMMRKKLGRHLAVLESAVATLGKPAQAPRPWARKTPRR